MIRRMVKLELIGLRKDLHAVVRELQTLGALHIEEPEALKERTYDFVQPISLEPDEAAEKQFLEGAESSSKEALALLGSHAGAAPAASPVDLTQRESVLARLRERVDRLRALALVIETLSESHVLAEKYKHVLELLEPLAQKREPGWQEFAIGLDKGNVKPLQRGLRKTTKRDLPMAFGKPKGDEVLAVLYVPDRLLDVAKQAAWKQGAYEVVLPKEFRGQPLAQSLAELDRRLAEFPRALAQARAACDSYARSEAPWLRRVAAVVAEHLDRFRVLSNLIETRYTFYLTAWTPAEQFPAVAKALAEKFPDSVSVRELGHDEWGEEEAVPVELKNPGWLKPFELLVKVFPPPVYGSMDATFLIALFFPAFFGIILGDIGYGAILLGLSLWARAKWKASVAAQRVAMLGVICGVSSIIFGFVFGEIFGTLAHGWLKPLWADRLFVMTEYLILSIVIGILHIMLGLILGIVLAWQHGSIRHVLEKLGFLFFTLGSIAAVLGLAASRGVAIPIVSSFAPTQVLWTGLGGIALAVVLILVGAGPLMLIEVFSLISNIMSYARLMAIGIASVSLAKVANDLGSSLGGIAGLSVAVLLHAINMVLGIFDPTVQSLRLHYVEFFTKFYQPGGRAYEPFRKSA